MKKRVGIFAFCLLQGVLLVAQDNFGVIKNTNEYLEVSDLDTEFAASGNKIMKYQPFDCLEQGDYNESSFINIRYADFEKHALGGYFYNPLERINDEYYDMPFKYGYLPESQVQHLAQLPKVPQLSSSDAKAEFGNADVQLTIEVGAFDPKKHLMKNKEDKKLIVLDKLTASDYVQTVDGEGCWGTDGNIPQREIKSMKLLYKGKTMTFSAADLKNVFEPNLGKEFTNVCVGTDGEIYIWMKNGDGAGSYHIIWVVVDGKVKYKYSCVSWYA